MAETFTLRAVSITNDGGWKVEFGAFNVLGHEVFGKNSPKGPFHYKPFFETFRRFWGDRTGTDDQDSAIRFHGHETARQCYDMFVKGFPVQIQIQTA